MESTFYGINSHKNNGTNQKDPDSIYGEHKETTFHHQDNRVWALLYAATELGHALVGKVNNTAKLVRGKES